MRVYHQVSRHSVKSVFNLYGFNFRPAIKHATGRRMMLCFVFQLYLGRRSGDRHGGDVFTGPNEFMARKHEGLVPLMKNDSFDYIFFPSQKSTPEIEGSLFSRTDKNWMTKLKRGAEEIVSCPPFKRTFS